MKEINNRGVGVGLEEGYFSFSLIYQNQYVYQEKNTYECRSNFHVTSSSTIQEEKIFELRCYTTCLNARSRTTNPTLPPLKTKDLKIFIKKNTKQNETEKEKKERK